MNTTSGLDTFAPACCFFLSFLTSRITSYNAWANRGKRIPTISSTRFEKAKKK